MLPETENFMREILRLSKKINSKKFKSIQSGMELIREETELLLELAGYVCYDLDQRADRYFYDLEFKKYSCPLPLDQDELVELLLEQIEIYKNIPF